MNAICNTMMLAGIICIIAGASVMISVTAKLLPFVLTTKILAILFPIGTAIFFIGLFGREYYDNQ